MTMICVEGKNDRDHVAVTSHATGVVDELKNIDDRFFLMLNRITQKFEVHVRDQRGSTLGCELPFDNLDGRVPEYVRERLTSRMDAFVEKIEKKNEQIDASYRNATMDKAGYKTAEAIRYADHHPSKDGEPLPKEMIEE